MSYQIDVAQYSLNYNITLPSGVLIYVKEPIETLSVEMVPRETVN